jgi:hypothetical protein
VARRWCARECEEFTTGKVEGVLGDTRNEKDFARLFGGLLS